MQEKVLERGERRKEERKRRESVREREGEVQLFGDSVPVPMFHFLNAFYMFRRRVVHT